MDFLINAEKREKKGTSSSRNIRRDGIEKVKKLEKEIKLAILKKAALMEKDGFKKYYEQVGKYKGKLLEKKQ